jgi:hypothetical protein
MESLKDICPTKANIAASQNLKSVAFTKGRHFLVKYLFDNEAYENDYGRYDAAYDDKFHDFSI